jgi:RNA polymerase sigma factor (sigma-70 family)
MNVDQEIWNDFLTGKNYAISYIYYNNIQFLYRYGKKFSNDSELVKDTIQDLFFDLIRTREHLNSTDNIRYYLMFSLRRKLEKKLKKNNKHIEQPDTVFTIDSSNVYSVEQQFIEKEELNERELLIQNALLELTDKQREILYYRFTCGFDYDKICELMSLKYETAKKLNYRSIVSLKKYMSEKGIHSSTFVFHMIVAAINIP